MDIIMRLENTIANNGSNFKNYFQRNGVIQGVGSYFPVSTVLLEMAHIVPKHTTSTRKDYAKYFGKCDKERDILNPFNGRLTDPEEQDVVKMAN